MTNSADYLCALISELLYEHRQLHLPGLGAFLLQYKPAVVDNLQGQLLPPSLDLSFDTNLVMDDGLLVEQLRQRSGWSAEVAAEAISGFVAGIREQLSRGELVHLPNIGRLHTNHEHRIVFKADNYNYNKDSFGLPVLQATTVMRSVNSSSATAAQTVNTTQAQSAGKGSGLRGWYWLFGAFAVLTAGIIYTSIYANRLAAERQAAEAAAAESDMAGDAGPSGARINVAPSADMPEEPAAKGEAVDQQRSAAAAEQAAKSRTQPAAAGKSATGAAATPPAATTKPAPGTADKPAEAGRGSTATKPAPGTADKPAEAGRGSTATKPAPGTAGKPAEAATTKPAPAGKSVAWVSVGKFGSPDNAARMNQRIAEAGYEPFSSQEDGLTRVGVLLSFSSEAELQQQLAKIRRLFASGAFVVKREPLRN